MRQLLVALDQADADDPEAHEAIADARLLLARAIGDIQAVLGELVDLNDQPSAQNPCRTVPDRTDVLMMPSARPRPPARTPPVTLPWSPAGWWLVAGAVLVTAAIVFVCAAATLTTIVGLLGVLAGAVLWSVCSALELSAGDLTGREYWAT